VTEAVRGATVAFTPTAASTSRAPIAIRDGTRASRRVVRAARTLRGSRRLRAVAVSAGARPFDELVCVSTGHLAHRDSRSSPHARSVGRRCLRRLYTSAGPAGATGLPELERIGAAS
jgi:hypothetical protein